MRPSERLTVMTDLMMAANRMGTVGGFASLTAVGLATWLVWHVVMGHPAPASFGWPLALWFLSRAAHQKRKRHLAEWHCHFETGLLEARGDL